MRTAGALAGAVVALAALGGCTTDGGAGTAPAPPSIAPATVVNVTARVAIVDDPPLDIYFDTDDQRCTSNKPEDIADKRKTPRVQVVVRDAGGSIVGATRPPLIGGHFSKREGCRVTVVMELPGSDFYEVRVTGGSSPVSRRSIVDAADLDLPVEVTF